MSKNILDILTKVDRPTFTIDDNAYELRHPNELSMTEFHTLMKKGVALVSFSEQMASDPDGAFNSIIKCMNDLMDMIAPDLPSTVREKLNPFHVQQILEAFIGLSRIEPKPDAQLQQDKPLHDSSDSTEAAQKTG